MDQELKTSCTIISRLQFPVFGSGFAKIFQQILRICLKIFTSPRSKHENFATKTIMQKVLKRGILLPIEGTDGTGKKTQVKFLVDKLQTMGFGVVTVSFPQYGKKSAGLVEEYLNGHYGAPDQVSPYAASLFFALDRFDAAPRITELLEAGYIIILDRYVDSNAGHQGGKISDPEDRARFLAWLYDIEYNILQVPKPNFVIILHMPAEIGQALVAKKQERLYLERGTYDAHEADLKHLKNAEASYLWLAEKSPEDHRGVECCDGDRIFTSEEVSAKISEIVEELLRKRKEGA